MLSTGMTSTGELLQSQLQTFRIHFQTVEKPTDQTSIFDLKRYFLPLSPGQASSISQIRHLLQLILIMAATNATSERLFSVLCRSKNYLRTTMTQERLNHFMLLHVHKERTDKIDLKSVVNQFIDESEHHSSIFAQSNTNYILQARLTTYSL